MQNSVSRKAAWWVSMILNPFVVPPIIFGLVAHSNGMEGQALGQIIGIATFLYFIIPVVYLVVLLRLKAIDSLEARDKSKRQAPMYWGAFWVIIAIPIMIWFSNGSPFVFGLIGGVLALNAVLLAVINRQLKISIHVAGVSGLFSILLALLLTHRIASDLLGTSFFAITLIAISLVAWARVHSNAHHLKEVFLGALFGLFVPIAEIYLVSLIWGH